MSVSGQIPPGHECPTKQSCHGHMWFCHACMTLMSRAWFWNILLFVSDSYCVYHLFWCAAGVFRHVWHSQMCGCRLPGTLYDTSASAVLISRTIPIVFRGFILMWLVFRRPPYFARWGSHPIGAVGKPVLWENMEPQSRAVKHQCVSSTLKCH